MSRLRLYEMHGVVFTGEAGNEAIGRCPFTDREDKFYVNKLTGLWDSKTLEKGGNPSTFLKLIADQYHKALTLARRRDLAIDRNLSSDAFRGWNLGWTGRQYSIPIRNANGTVTDVRLYKPRSRVISTATAETGLLGAERLKDNPHATVYICEGEWDAIALQWAFKETAHRGLVVAVPGAGVFKKEWVTWLTGRAVITLYDHDEAGLEGEEKVWRLLKPVAKSLHAVHWPETLPTGFDVRDWFTTRADTTLPKRVADLMSLTRNEPRRRSLDAAEPNASVNPAAVPESEKERPPSKWTKKAPTFADLEQTFRKWLFLDTMDTAEIMAATSLSQLIDGPPIWMFMVGPPGSSKTEHIVSLSLVPNVHMTSSLTPHSLISGANWKDGMDPSLIPRLDGRVLAIKDFTAIMGMRDNEKEEVFAVLRDAYDGKCGKVFGNGIERHYVSRFTIIAAVTPRIYDLGSNHASLGERFLKYTIGDNLIHRDEKQIILRAINNVNQSTQMQDELADVMQSFIDMRIANYKKPPEIPDPIKQKLIYLGMFGARLRGTVSHDTYRHDIITSRPSAEVGSRLGIQLAKLAQSLALVHGRTEVTDHDYRLVRKTMLDTIAQRTEDVLRQLIALMRGNDDGMASSQDLAIATRYPIATITRLIQDLNVLGIVQQCGTNLKHRWKLTPYIEKCLDVTGLYQNGEDMARRPQVHIRVRRQAARKNGHA